MTTGANNRERGLVTRCSKCDSTVAPAAAVRCYGCLEKSLEWATGLLMQATFAAIAEAPPSQQLVDAVQLLVIDGARRRGLNVEAALQQAKADAVTLERMVWRCDECPNPPSDLRARVDAYRAELESATTVVAKGEMHG